MSVGPPPWADMPPEEVAQRLAMLTTSSFLQCSGRCPFTKHATFSSGLNELDQLLPNGGLTCGTVLEVFGPPAVGKSRLVRHIVSAFAVRGALEWTAMCFGEGRRSSGSSRALEVQQRGPRMERESCKPNDWSVFYALSDLSSFNPRHMKEEFERMLRSAMVGNVSCDSDIGELLSDMLARVKVVSFATPNDILSTLRFLYHEEYRTSMHHANQRRMLVVVDSLARLWDHPACGSTHHARHWAAAELVRELRNVVMIGNGWRGEYCDAQDGQHSDSGAGSVHCSLQAANAAGEDVGSVAVVIVNGCSSARDDGITAAPLGVPVWLAGAADVRVFVEPSSSSSDLPTAAEEDDDGMPCTQQCDTARSMLFVRVTKGGGASGHRTGTILLP